MAIRCRTSLDGCEAERRGNRECVLASPAELEERFPLDRDVFIRQCDACLRHDTADRLRGIRQPTLVICGRHDQLTPPKLHRELADVIPNAHLMTLSYGAHLVMAECAQQLNEAVLHFLAEG